MAYVAVWTSRNWPGQWEGLSVTASLGAVAFHGRNREAWSRGNGSRKFRYNYSDDELGCLRRPRRGVAPVRLRGLFDVQQLLQGLRRKNALRMKCLLGIACSPGEGSGKYLSMNKGENRRNCKNYAINSP